jgi:hypothetical protein
MISRATLAKNFDLHKVQQIVKWAVYIFLLVNWGFYIVEDWTRAAHTLTADSTSRLISSRMKNGPAGSGIRCAVFDCCVSR